MTFEEIHQETNITKEVLIRTLLSLSMGKIQKRLLIRTPTTKGIAPSNEFYVNDAFVSKFYKYDGFFD
jgi:cullin 3